MVARDDSYEYIAGRGGAYPYYDQRDDYEYGGYAGGADAARQGMQNQSDLVQQRQGVQIDNRDATHDLIRAAADRGNQQYLAGYLQNIANGSAMSPAQMQLAAQNRAATAAQHGLAMSAQGFGAIGGADRNALVAGNQMGIQGQRMMAIQRAQDMAMARDQYGSVLDSMRGQDVQSGGLLQDQAYNQAQLSDQQRAANDAMARFYLNQRYQIGSDQLGASEDYERERYKNALGQSDLDWQSQTRRDDQNRQQQAAALSGMGQGLSVAQQTADQENNGSKPPY